MDRLAHEMRLSIPECKKLKNIWDNRKQHRRDYRKNADTLGIDDQIENFSERFYMALGECQQGLFNTCHPSLKEINEVDLNAQFKQYIQNPLLRMKDPAGNCLHRAQILSEMLVKSGVNAKIAEFNAPTMIGLVKDEKNTVKSYYEYAASENGFHAIVVVPTKLANGKVEDRYLDPQFTDHPMSKEEYSRLLTNTDCTNTPKKSTHCSVQISSLPKHKKSMDIDPLEFLEGTSLLDESCGVKDFKRFHEATLELRSAVSAAEPIPEDLHGKSEKEIRESLQRKTLEKLVARSEEALAMTEKYLIGINKGILPPVMTAQARDTNDPSLDAQTRAVLKTALADIKKQVEQELPLMRQKLEKYKEELRLRTK